MPKNLNTGIWTVDSNGWTQTVQTLFTGESPTYTHAEHIDNSFNLAVCGVSGQNNRMLFHLTDRTRDDGYNVENTTNIFIGNYFYDNRGNYTDAIGTAYGNVGGVSNFAIAADSGNQPSANFKIAVEYTYRDRIWFPRVNIRTFDSTNGTVGSDNFMTLNALDAESTAGDAQPGETWWQYYKRNESNYIMSIDTYNAQAYYKIGAFDSTSVFEGQRFNGVPYCKIEWLKSAANFRNFMTSGCYTYYGNNRDYYGDMQADVIFPFSAEWAVKKAEYNDTFSSSGWTRDRHNIFYGLKIDKDIVLKLICSYGMPFSFSSSSNIHFADPDYALPEIKDNIITGNYFRGEECATADTDNNRWGNVKNIDNQPAGGGGGGGGSYDDDPWHGASFSGVGVGGAGAFAKCYYMTSTELANLRSWMGSISVPEGFNPMEQVIGLSQVPVALSGDAPETVQFVNSSAVYDPGVTTRVVDSGVSTQQAMGTPIKYSLGSVDITRRMQERGEPYLDYSCQIELYLPLIGVFSLDTQAVMGRTISAEAVLDPTSGTLAAYAWVEKEGQKLPVAYGSTSIGVDLPITAQQYSVAKAALKQANAQLATSLLSSALTMMASASASGKAAAYGNGRATAASGMRSATEGFNSFTQAASISASQTMVSQTGNVFGSFMDWGRSIRQLSYGNNTAIAGSFGGSSAQWTYPFNAYVKIIRPRFEKPNNYKHTQGVPCVQNKRVGDCTGFIQCIGVDVINIANATDLEKQAIQAALTNGVYAGGGS